MDRIRTIQASTFLGAVLFIAGVFSSQYMVVRPNRVENGINLNYGELIGGNRTVLISTVSLFVFFGIFMILKLLTIGNIVLRLTFVIIGFGTFLFNSGYMATLNVVTLESSARVSMGVGFWCVLISLLLLIFSEVKEDLRSKPWVVLICFFIVGIFYYLGILSDISMVREFNAKSDRIVGELVNHLQLSVTASMIGFVISLIVSYLVYKDSRFEGAVNAVANFAQVIPTLSLLGLLMIPLTALSNQFPFLKSMGISGIGFFPAFIVLTLYTLLPITANAIAGFRDIPSSVKEAAHAMGMNQFQCFLKVELPMATPSLFTGFRIALVQTVGNCILAGLVGGGGLGTILFLGLAQSAPDLVTVASLLVVSIAVICETLLSTIESYFKLKIRGDLIYD